MDYKLIKRCSKYGNTQKCIDSVEVDGIEYPLETILEEWSILSENLMLAEEVLKRCPETQDMYFFEKDRRRKEIRQMKGIGVIRTPTGSMSIHEFVQRLEVLLCNPLIWRSDDFPTLIKMVGDVYVFLLDMSLEIERG